ncbi:hypothetical protein CcI49_34200 [Frankia sp. CcI49]|uniref:hypothetical protein n=1 Tax=Frankia sp. CcI49 TaxID=1745382 RepID=UPI000975CD5A|nr:hypothetical protein [Frankia sp. CcI49]ONH52398.1 hypothetical protein CcI49_34200 [Frankia sp. CcI49]
MNRVKVGFIALTGLPKSVSEAEYLEWHATRHMPEQFTVPGIVNAQRWHSTAACRAQRAAQSDDLVDAENLVSYLLSDPVEQNLAEFQALNRRLNETGRFIEPSPFLMLGAYKLLEPRAAERTLISDHAVPWRPNLGVYLVVERLDPERAEEYDSEFRGAGADGLLSVPGVAGVYLYGTAPGYQTSHQVDQTHRVTVAYLDADPATVGAAVRPLLEERWKDGGVEPVFAGPFESVVQWNWQRFTEPEQVAGSPS